MKTNSVLLIIVFIACVGAMPDRTLGADVPKLFIERIEPPSLSPGKTTLVKIHGTGVSGAQYLWTSLPVGTIKAGVVRTSNVDVAAFDVTISKDAALGVFGLRVATSNGLSNLHLFAIDDLPIVMEKESEREPRDPEARRIDRNNRFANAESIRLPAAVVGTLPETDVDSFAIEVQAGQRVSFETVGSRLGKAFDPLVTIFDSNARRVISSDNSIGLIFDSRFEHTFEAAGRYIVQLRDTRFHGSPNWSYMLRMGRFPAARVAIPSTVQPGKPAVISLPELGIGPRQFKIARSQSPSIFEPNGSSQRFFAGFREPSDEGSAWLFLARSELSNHLEAEPNNVAEKATSVSVPANLHGIISQVDDEDWFSFELKKGASLTFRAETRAMGSPADLELALFGPGGKELRRKDDDGFDDAHFTFRATQDGVHRLQVVEIVGKAGPGYVYRVEVSTSAPRIDLTSEAGRLAVPKGSWQPLSLKVNRTNYRGPVELSLLGAPAGMTLRNREILPKEDTLLGILDVAANTKEGVYSVQVIARGVDSETARGPQAVARTFPLVDRVPSGTGPHGEPFELREDQRRLPPTVIDRLAICVLPKSPYEFNVESQLVVLPRYLETTFDITTSFSAQIDGDVSFVARGGTLEAKRLRKPTTQTFIPSANANRKTVTARLTSGVNTPIVRHRVTVTGAAEYQGRTVYLTRVFDLETTAAFAPAPTRSVIEAVPGQTVTITLAANRLKPYDGPVNVALSPPTGIEVQPMIQFAAGKEQEEVTLQIAKDIKPGKHSIAVTSAARIGKFSEKVNAKIYVTVKSEK